MVKLSSLFASSVMNIESRLGSNPKSFEPLNVVELTDMTGNRVRVNVDSLAAIEFRLFGLSVRQIANLRQFYLRHTGKYPEDEL